MYTTEPFQVEGDDIILGIFGSSVFIDVKKGEGRHERNAAVQAMARALKTINPKLAYITPSPGVPLHLTTILNYLKIPFVIVSPSKGYFSRYTKENRSLLKKAVTECRSVVVVNDVKANMLNFLDLEGQSEDFIINNSDLILSIYGSSKSDFEKVRHEKLNDIEKDVIFLNYSII